MPTPTPQIRAASIVVENSPPPQNRSGETSIISLHSLWRGCKHLLIIKQDDHRLVKITKNVIQAGKIGLQVYLVFYGLSRLRLCKKPDRLTSYLLTSVTRTALIEAGKLVYDTTLLILGDRKIYENLKNDGLKSIYERLRQRSWKTISQFEALTSSVDASLSNLLGIRTRKTIRESFDSDENYLLSEPYLMEIAREALFNQVQRLYSLAINVVSLQSMQSMGYTMPGLQTLCSLKRIQLRVVALFFFDILQVINLKFTLDNHIDERDRKYHLQKKLKELKKNKSYQLLKAMTPLHFTRPPPSSAESQLNR